MTGRKGKIPYLHFQYLHHHHYYYYHQFSAHLYLLATIPMKYNDDNNNNENADSGGKSDTAHIMSSHVRHLSLLKIGKCTGISTRKTHTHTHLSTQRQTNNKRRRTVCVSVQRSELSDKTKRIGGGNKQVCRCKQSRLVMCLLVKGCYARNGQILAQKKAPIL